MSTSDRDYISLLRETQLEFGCAEHEEHPSWSALKCYSQGGLDPERRSRLSAHIVQCGYCDSIVQALRREEAADVHPSETELLERVYDQLAEDERAAIDAHVRACRVCADKVAILRNELKPAEGLLNQVLTNPALWQQVQEVTHPKASACPAMLALLRYSASRAQGEDADRLPADLENVGEHIPICSDCARKARLLQSALIRGKGYIVHLSTLLASAESDAHQIIRNLGSSIRDAIEAGLGKGAPAAVRARGLARTGMQVKLADHNGEPTGEAAVFGVRQPPQIARGQLRFVLTAPEQRFEGWEIDVRLVVEPDCEVALDLGATTVHNCAASFSGSVAALGLDYEPAIPVDMIDLLAIPPREQQT